MKKSCNLCLKVNGSKIECYNTNCNFSLCKSCHSKFKDNPKYYYSCPYGHKLHIKSFKELIWPTILVVVIVLFLVTLSVIFNNNFEITERGIKKSGDIINKLKQLIKMEEPKKNEEPKKIEELKENGEVYKFINGNPDYIKKYTYSKRDDFYNRITKIDINVNTRSYKTYSRIYQKYGESIFEIFEKFINAYSLDENKIEVNNLPHPMIMENIKYDTYYIVEYFLINEKIETIQKNYKIFKEIVKTCDCGIELNIYNLKKFIISKNCPEHNDNINIKECGK